MDSYIRILLRNRISKEVLHNIQQLKRAFSQKLFVAKQKKSKHIYLTLQRTIEGSLLLVLEMMMAMMSGFMMAAVKRTKGG